MNKKSLLKFQCVTALALTAFSPMLSTFPNVYAAETSYASAASNQSLDTNFTSKQDQTALVKIAQTGNKSLKIKNVVLGKRLTNQVSKTSEESTLSTTSLEDGSIFASLNVEKDKSYYIRVEYDKSGLGSKEATLTTAILLKDGSTSSSAKRFNSKEDLDNLQNAAIESLKSRSMEIENKLEIERLKDQATLDISSYDTIKDLSAGKLKIEDLKISTDSQKKTILEKVSKFSMLDQSTKKKLQFLRDDLSNEILNNKNATSQSIKDRLKEFNDIEEQAFKAISIIDQKTEDDKTKETVSKSENESNRSTGQRSQSSSNDQNRPKESNLNKSTQKSESSDKKSQNSDIKNEPAKVASSVDSKSSSKVDTSKLEEVLKISEQLLAKQVDTSKVSEEGKKDLEQSKKNLSERVDRYKPLIKSEKSDQKSINVAIEDLRAVVGHYSLLLDLKSAVDAPDKSSSADDSNAKKDTANDQKSSVSDQVKDQAKDQAKDQTKDLDKDKDLNKSDKSKSVLDNKPQDQKSRDTKIQGKTPRKFAETGEKDNKIVSILGILGLTSLIGFIYKIKTRN